MNSDPNEGLLYFNDVELERLEEKRSPVDRRLAPYLLRKSQRLLGRSARILAELQFTHVENQLQAEHLKKIAAQEKISADLESLVFGLTQIAVDVEYREVLEEDQYK